MMKTITTLEELREEIESGKYNYYGLRGATEHDLTCLDRGYLDCSLDNFDDNYSEYDESVETLNGTSAIFVSADTDLEERYTIVKNIYLYETKTALLIADNNSEWGDDEDEIVLGGDGYGANVVAIVAIVEL